MRLLSWNGKKVEFVRSVFGGRRIPIADPFELSTFVRRVEDREDKGSWWRRADGIRFRVALTRC